MQASLAGTTKYAIVKAGTDVYGYDSVDVCGKWNFHRRTHLSWSGAAVRGLRLGWVNTGRGRLLHAFPIGGGSVTLTGIGAFLLALVVSALGVFLFLLAWVSTRVALQRCNGSFSCVLTSAEWPAWVWFGLCAFWFFFVWLRLGDTRKRVLVYGVWYHQEKVARLIAQQLREEGQTPITKERHYALQEQIVRLLHTERWLIHDKEWLDGKNVVARQAPQEEIIAETLRAPEFAESSGSEREAVRLLVTYFLRRADSAKHMSPLARWWVGSAQIGKLQTYGARAT